MASVRTERLTATIDGDFVVFLIGMRINTLWKIHKWLPVAAAMPRMLAQLEREPRLGLLHARLHFGLRNIMVVQYWRSFEMLHAFAVDDQLQHVPAWKAFNGAANNGDVGIWHETYLVQAGRHESLYVNMPPFGLGRASKLVAATGNLSSARKRLGQN